MVEEKKIICNTCKQTVTVHSKNTPECCGQPMKVVNEICIQPAHSEHARPMDEEEACDDFRGGT